MDLRYEYFWSRIEFAVDDVNIGKFWGSMPVLDFARSMRFLANTIDSKGKVSIGFTEHPTVVSFTRIGDLVEIRDPNIKTALSCDLNELVTAARRFVNKVADQLAADHPDIVRNEFFAALRMS
jgi:hypothetical protein